ncbi:hypothetical protein LIER_37235 [Lithospermum erythrorhizon]|uniref:Uncharacterized protein n=1 Tax=Lithospermum erythrorhizon TaxID=34254 RepID=A0AAV3PIQ2_LITER
MVTIDINSTVFTGPSLGSAEDDDDGYWSSRDSTEDCSPGPLNQVHLTGWIDLKKKTRTIEVFLRKASLRLTWFNWRIGLKVMKKSP